MKVQSLRAVHCRTVIRRKALAIAIGGSIALAFAGGAWAQAVNGTIQGTVPVAPNETVQITGGAGYSRTVTVGASGRYSVTVPVGTYTVTLLQHGKVVQSQPGVSPAAAGGATVNFSSASKAVQNLSAVNVNANAMPAIDVNTTTQVTTITSQQLQQLPIARTAENIALLAPGVQQAGALLQMNNPTPMGTPALSFGGATDAENAYYIDGFNTTDQLTGQGGYSLPYGAILQQQTMISGYGAKYGRSIGGVISQIGKSGSNTWHFGARASWQPGNMESAPVNQYWSNPRSTTPGETIGNLRTYRKNNIGQISVGTTGDTIIPGSEYIYDAYVSGPIIKDRLFFFLGAESDNVLASANDAMSPTAKTTFAEAHRPKIYAKINWNINENNIFTLTGLQQENKNWLDQYSFNYNTFTNGDKTGSQPTLKNAMRLFIANYTSYLTDSLTLHAMFGKMHTEYYTQMPGASGLPAIQSASKQNPAFTPPGGFSNSNTTVQLADPNHRSSVMNYRVDLDYTLGNHDLSFGIDNITSWDMDDGVSTTGPGYSWLYGQTNSGNALVGGTPTNPAGDPSIAPWVGSTSLNGAAGAGGYYVSQYIFSNAASVRITQRAEYIQDNWHVTPNLLLNLGLRNGTFVNYNPAGTAYVRETTPNWMPRIGFSWNAFGDNSLKVFGNAGRYYIVMPAGVALRGAGASTFTNLYGTYTGVNPDGTPKGFAPLPQNNGGHPGMGTSANGEYGVLPNPELVTAQNVKPEYSDNFVLGAQWEFTPGYVAGATLMYQKLGRILDDWDDQLRICAAGLSQGLSYMTPQTCGEWTSGLNLMNPTETEHLRVTSPSGALNTVTVNQAQQGFPNGVERNYHSVDLSLTHPWDGKWFGKADLLYSESYGNTEGPVDSIIGQGGDSVVITEQWDFAQLMEYADGRLPNDARWQFKLYGAYAITPEWMIGANLAISSGHPNVCLGYYGSAETDPLGYATGNGTNGAYHYCGGHPAPPGSTGFTPWTHTLDLNVTYSPEWASHKLTFNAAVFNVFNTQTPLQYFYGYGTTAAPEPRYNMPQFWTPPRYWRFSVAYNF